MSRPDRSRADAAARAVRSAPQPAHRCGACGATYTEGTWSALALQERIDAGELGDVVSRWPDGTCIEVRRCSRCGHAVAAKRPQPP